jgi:alpha-tubulin suppressor-like RCC1 family protein
MKRPTAEVVEFFKKSDISIIQIVMSKFHSVFLSRSGEVYTCGFGLDGRLGHDDELINSLLNFFFN